MGRLGLAGEPPNKGMKQTKLEHIGASQLIPGVGPTAWGREVLIKGLKWLGVRTPHFEAMAGFCRDVLGLTTLSHGSDCVDFELPNGDRVEIFAPSFATEEPLDVPVVGFLVDDVRAARRELEGRGVEFIGPVHEGASLAWSYFRAPDGHMYEITGPVEH